MLFTIDPYNDDRKFSYHSQETIQFTIDPYYGNLK